METVLRNENSFRLLFTFLERWKSLRCLNSHCNRNITKYILLLKISENSPKIIIQTLINKLPYIEVLILFKNQQTDDSLVQNIYRTCKKLKYLSLDYCNNISSEIFLNKPDILCISMYGCWRIQNPDTHKTPEDIVEIQMWCFQYINDGGYDKLLEFVSEYYQFVFLNSLKRGEMEAITNSSSFSIMSSLQHFNNAIVQIESTDNKNCSKKFRWILNKIDDKWFTTYILGLND